MGLDDAVVTGEFERLAQAFAAGAIANSPSLPITALVVQVLAACHKFSLLERFII